MYINMTLSDIQTTITVRKYFQKSLDIQVDL